MPSSHLLLAVVALLLCLPSSSATVYPVTSGPGLGRRFDGIGALSGGGCTSRLLVDYVEPQRSEILDYLFLPSFGASLHLLKVEIGGDAQSTEGTEPSHMHYEGEENYHRGYEWWLMREAKRRNPSILLYALSWGFPRWVGEGGNLPFTNSTVRYTLNWLRNAKAVHNLTIDYAGIWNERGYTADYIISLSRAIKAAGLSTRVVGHDSNWDICAPVLKDAELAAAVDVIGAHYPGSSAAAECQLTGKPLWASEEMSKPWNTGGQCWARVLNQNYVRANMTGSIAWNLIATYYDDLPFPGDGVLHGDTPWDGHYDVGHVMHATSHTTHFTAPGWSYLSHGSGVGLLSGGGSYVSLTPLDRQQLTIVIETMPFNSSQCSWSTSPSFTIAPSQNATFQMDAPWSSLKGLYLFTSNLSEGADPAQDFTAHGLQAITDGVITLTVHEAMLYTLSSINSRRGSHPTPPAASAFPPALCG